MQNYFSIINNLAVSIFPSFFFYLTEWFCKYHKLSLILEIISQGDIKHIMTFWRSWCLSTFTTVVLKEKMTSRGFRFMVCNATFDNISAILLRSVLLVEETGVPGENHRPVTNFTNRCQDNCCCFIYNLVIYIGITSSKLRPSDYTQSRKLSVYIQYQYNYQITCHYIPVYTCQYILSQF